MESYIEIAKEDIHREYVFRSYVGAPKPPERNRNTHGRALRTELSSAVATITSNRRDIGVDADTLFVFQLSSGVATPDIDILQSKLKLVVMEEVKCTDGTTKYVVQFDSKEGIDAFEAERALWENDSQDNSSMLTSAQRRDLFACIETIRPLSPEDRTGKRLADAILADNLPDGLFLVDIDVWFDGDNSKRSIIEGKIKKSLGTGESILLGDLFVIPNLLLGRAKVNHFTLKALLNLDLIAKVDFPIGVLSTEQCELYSANFVPVVDNVLGDNAPLACIIDSGVFSGNPLLSSLIVGEEDFDLTEKTTSDLHGHGTGVAGIVAYGDFDDFDKENRVFKPLVRICNGKVMHNHTDGVVYDDTKRPEQIVSEAIRYFHDNYQCRIFNLSSGSADRIYNGGRQMAWASMLDELVRELDIVVVVSAGNVFSANVPHFTGREDLMAKARNQLLDEEHRLIDPATTALGITVGSITRYGEPENLPNRQTYISAGKEGYPSVFTRTGDGVCGAIKPEFVDFGGNLALHQPTSTQTRWQKNKALLEPTISRDISRVFAGNIGTSFAAPHVTHIAARLQHALKLQLGEEPTANLIRALLASSAKYVNQDWLETVIPNNFTGAKKQKQEWRLRLSGYGKVDDTTLFTDHNNHVTLFAEEKLNLRQIHLYKIPVPSEFLELNTTKRIAIGFAYNPPTRLSRKDYIANSLWFEVFKRIDVEMLLKYKAKKENADEDAAEKIIEKLGEQYRAKFSPGYTEVRNSTLQQRVWEKGKKGGPDLLWQEHDPYIHVLVTGKAKFKHPAELEAQPYALVITFSYDGKTDIQLRQKLSEQVKIKQREQVRTRTQIQV